MKRETGFYLDTSDFDKKLDNLDKKIIPDASKKGLADGMNKLLSDSIELPPQAPFKEGELWGSIAGTVEVFIKRGVIFVVGGFNKIYARRHHEAEPGEFKYTITGAKQPGPKFMQSKMVQFKNKYMEIVANSIRRRGK